MRQREKLEQNKQNHTKKISERSKETNKLSEKLEAPQKRKMSQNLSIYRCGLKIMKKQQENKIKQEEKNKNIDKSISLNCTKYFLLSP